MSEQLKIRLATPEDAPQLAEWLNGTTGNLYDSAILKYPTLRVLCAYNGNGPSVYLPSQTALVLESLAVKPGTPPIEAARAFRDLVKGMELVASGLGVRELYFVCADPGVAALAAAHGFELIAGVQKDVVLLAKEHGLEVSQNQCLRLRL